MLSTANAAAIVGGSKDPLTLSEADKYRRMWQHDDYRNYSPAHRLRAEIDELLVESGSQAVLDLGAGTGRLSAWLLDERYDVHLIDIAENCLDHKVKDSLQDRLTVGCIWELDPADFESDFVVCVDVLEHIPTPKVPAVARFIKDVAPHGFLQAATYPDHFGSRIGETLHLTVKPPGWWAEHFPDAEVTTRGENVDIVF